MNPGVRTILNLHVLLVAAAASTAVLTVPAAAPSLFLGGAVMGANFWLLAAIARRALGGTGRPGGWVAALVLVKFSAFIGLLGLLMRRAPVDPVSFGFGASLLLVACVVGAFRMRPALV